MTSKQAIAILITFAPGVLLAQGVSYQCTFGDLQRRVEIFTEPGVSVPCEVHYYKDTEAPGERQVLWSASNQEGYCEQKTEEFVAKLEGWGWDCDRGEAATESAPVMEMAPEPAVDPAPEAAPEAMEADDTDALAPSE